MADRFKPGEVRDAILALLRERGEGSVLEMVTYASAKLGRAVPQSSVRSYLNLNTPGTFTRVKHGRYRLAKS